MTRRKMEPLGARFHFIPRRVRRGQQLLVRLLHSYFERAPGWVLLTTRGRRSGLPREVLLPCERTPDAVIVISTYGWRSDWIQNIQKEPRVRLTCAGWQLGGRAEIIDDTDRKLAIVTSHPFFPAAPFLIVHMVLRTLLRPVLVFLLRRWVRPRPIVVIYAEAVGVNSDREDPSF